MFTGISAELIDEVWPFVEGEITRICTVNGGRWEAEDVKKYLKERHMQLWVYAPKDLQALCLTEIITYPKFKTCRVVGVAGSKRDDWKKYLSVIEEWARSQGCAKVEMIARKGWARVIEDYRATQIFFEKEILNGQK